jgi:diacylglycerol O-acyltransferase / wax synthase
MSTTRLSPLDAAWLFTETRATPNHVGGLLQFKLPPDAPKDFMRQLMLDFRSHRSFAAPWSNKLKVPFNKNPAHSWIEADDIDMEYHVRHAALPWPGGERELGELVGRLHSAPIDLARPPWECTIIEGLEGDRFALFIKMHHSLIDGVSGVKLLHKAMATDPEASLKLPPFWATGNTSQGKEKRRSQTPTVASATAAALEELSLQAKSLPQLALAFGKIIKRIGDPSDGLVVPFNSPRSVLNGRVREKRRFATQQFSMERLRNVATEAGCTLNDVVLTLCGGALRRFLGERESLPAKSLTAGIPVSVRPKDDEGTGNAISFIVATLGTKRSVQHAKAHVQSLPRQVMTQYTMLLMAPTLLTLLSGIGGRLPPMFNITISNVPGPDKPLYFRGAELLSIYPASIVTHGQALNITCESYAGQMNFGFTACHTSLPSTQKLAVYTGEALVELETLLGLAATPKKVAKAAAPKTTMSTKATKAPARKVAAKSAKPAVTAKTSKTKKPAK